MAVTLDKTLGTATAQQVNSVNLAINNAVAVNSYVFLVAGRFCTSDGTLSASGGSLTWTEDKTVADNTQHLRISLFRALAPSGLSNGTTLTITPSVQTGITDIIVGGVALAGIDTSTPTTGNTNSGTGNGTAWSSGNVTNTSGNCIVGGGWNNDSGTNPSSTPTNGTEAFDIGFAAGAEALVGQYILSSSGSATPINGTWATTGHWGSVAVEYAAASAAAVINNAPITVVNKLLVRDHGNFWF